MNILFLDLETTGLDEDKHAIIEIAARYDEDGETKQEFHQKCFNPDAKVDLGALRVNRTTYTSLQSKQSEDIAVRKFADWLLNIPRKKVYLAGHNVMFDRNFVKALFKKHNIEGIDSVLSYRILDTSPITIFLSEMVKMFDFDALGVKSGGTLEKLCKMLEIDTTKKTLHTAKDDVDVTAEALYKLADMAKSKIMIKEMEEDDK